PCAFPVANDNARATAIPHRPGTTELPQAECQSAVAQRPTRWSLRVRWSATDALQMVYCGFPRENCIAHTRCKQVKASSLWRSSCLSDRHVFHALVPAQTECRAKGR